MGIQDIAEAVCLATADTRAQASQDIQVTPGQAFPATADIPDQVCLVTRGTQVRAVTRATVA